MGGIQIHSVGARAALGLSALQVAMGWRAGLFEPRASRLIDARGRAVGLCRIGGLGADVHGYDRLVTMAVPALKEATAGADLSGCALVLALPPAGRADDEPRFEQFAADLAQRAGLSFDSAHLIRRGHAGGIDAYRLARELLEGGSAGVVVGGVDSYYHPDVVRTLDEALRLHALDILDGIIPGEGAAFALLRNQASSGDVARLLDASVTSEPAMLDEELPNIADGLTAAVHAVAGNEAPWVMTDVTAEHWRTREWSLIAIRHQLVDAAVTQVAAELGDVGAASVAMMTALASTWWRHGIAPAPRALLLASSENDDRGAVVLESAGL